MPYIVKTQHRAILGVCGHVLIDLCIQLFKSNNIFKVEYCNHFFVFVEHNIMTAAYDRKVISFNNNSLKIVPVW